MKYAHFVWKKDDAIGIPELDEQHKHFFVIANGIFDFIEQPSYTKEEVMRKMGELADYAFFHFDTEEQLLNVLPREQIQEHLDMHAEYREEMKAFLRVIRSEASDVHIIAEAVAKFTNAYVKKHMFGKDEHHKLVLGIKGIKKN